ncbi:hypothetical protein M514_22764 [Trichuris suis]|uniref:DUF4371 domain-containing protein n=1 Tax=Trichuris suis TaxID=68888 RepID=A0A085N6F1_9BILA|nr:hypothetical protein M514_22764 [Trichuris suis]
MDGLRASFNISLMIARSGKAHTIGEELLQPVVSEVLRTVLHMPAAETIKSIPLSNNTVQRRIDEMGKNVEETLCNFLKSTKFSLQLDESSLPGNEAILLAYVRFIKEEDLAQEFLFARELVMDSKGKSIFQVVEGYFKEKEIPLANVISVATDGAPSMVGCQRGFISYLKKVVPNVLAIRCVIHRQHLVANCLILEFFEKEDASLCANLKKFEGDIAYMADLYTKFNEMNLQLQGDDLNLIKTKSVISAFVPELLYFKNNLARREFYNFPNLCELRRKGRINEQNVEVYWRHLELLHQDFIERFEDILSLEVPDWMTDPFSGVENAELQLQEELLELQANEELKPKFNLGYRAFWLHRVIPHLYPRLWNVVRKLLISFPSSYVAER